MNWKNHLMIGLLVELLVCLLIMWFFDVTFYGLEYALILTILFVSPLLPDLDHRNGKLREVLTYLGVVSLLVGAASYYFKLNFEEVVLNGIILVSVGYLPTYFTSHRGFLHTIRFCVMFAGIFYFSFGWPFALVAFVGSYSHLVADGIPFKV